MYKLKHFVFRYHLGIFVVLSASACIAFLVVGAFRLEFLFSIMGGLIAFVYFVQKQQLEEHRLFNEQFREFNKRYDDLNERLNRIVRSTRRRPLQKREVELLFDYFNLCGEEYLCYDRGYIYPRGVVGMETRHGDISEG